jgi:hypothetical protein
VEITVDLINNENLYNNNEEFNTTCCIDESNGIDEKDESFFKRNSNYIILGSIVLILVVGTIIYFSSGGGPGGTGGTGGTGGAGGAGGIGNLNNKENFVEQTKLLSYVPPVLLAQNLIDHDQLDFISTNLGFNSLDENSEISIESDQEIINTRVSPENFFKRERSNYY